MKRFPHLIAIIVLAGTAIQAQQALKPDDGGVVDGVYTSRFFDFKFTYPKGWVIQGSETDKRIRETAKERASSTGALTEDQTDTILKRTFSLLTVSEYELGTPGIPSNSVLQVMAEDVRHAPEITDGSSYLQTIRPLTEKMGAKFLQQEPVEIMVDGRRFFRSDYELSSNNRTFHQAMIVGFDKGYVLGFVFTAIDQAKVNHLTKRLDSLKFGKTPAPRLD